jgi:hypothetical protein
MHPEDERKRTLRTRVVMKHWCRQNQERVNLLGQVRRKPDDWADGDRRRGGVSWRQAFTRNCRNQFPDAKGEAQVVSTARREYRRRKLGRIGP